MGALIIKEKHLELATSNFKKFVENKHCNEILLNTLNQFFSQKKDFCTHLFIDNEFVDAKITMCDSSMDPTTTPYSQKIKEFLSFIKFFDFYFESSSFGQCPYFVTYY